MKKNLPTIIKDNFKSTTRLPEPIFPMLPPAIRELFENMGKDGQERYRDVSFLSLITILSSCFPNIFGRYFGEKVYANLYQIFGAPPASGKSAMLRPKYIADKIDLRYQTEGLASPEINTEPVNPKIRPSFTIPGNISAAGLMERISANQGRVLVIESETDTLRQILEQKFGESSDVYRKGYHHEQLSSYRKTDKESFSIPSPKISLLLTGTPEQLTKLVKSAENGLFSRICFYVFDTKPKYINPFSEEHTKNVELFSAYSEKVAEKYFSSLGQPEREFRFTERQVALFNEKFPDIVDDYYYHAGSEAVGIALRMGIIFFRIAMVLTAVRNESTTGDLVCSDEDFEIADKITDVLLHHSLAVYSLLSTPEENDSAELMLDEDLLKALPWEFDTKQVIKAMAKYGFGKRSAFRALDRLRENGRIVRVRLGWYRKTGNNPDKKQ